MAPMTRARSIWTGPAPVNNGGAAITSYKIERSADQIDWVTLVEAFDDH